MLQKAKISFFFFFLNYLTFALAPSPWLIGVQLVRVRTNLPDKVAFTIKYISEDTEVFYGMASVL